MSLDLTTTVLLLVTVSVSVFLRVCFRKYIISDLDHSWTDGLNLRRCAFDDFNPVASLRHGGRPRGILDFTTVAGEDLESGSFGSY